MDELEKTPNQSSHPPGRRIADEIMARVFDAPPKPASPLADVTPDEIEQGVARADEAIAAQATEPVKTDGESEVIDAIEFEGDDEPYSGEKQPNKPDSDQAVTTEWTETPFTGDQGSNMFPTITETPIETSSHISVDKSVDDLELEAIQGGLTKIGIRIPSHFTVSLQQWRNLRTIFLERSWALDEIAIKRALITFLTVFSPDAGKLDPPLRVRDARGLATLTIAALKKRKRHELAQALEARLPSLPARTSPPSMPRPSPPPPPSPKKK